MYVLQGLEQVQRQDVLEQRLALLCLLAEGRHHGRLPHGEIVVLPQNCPVRKVREHAKEVGKEQQDCRADKLLDSSSRRGASDQMALELLLQVRGAQLDHGAHAA